MPTKNKGVELCSLNEWSSLSDFIASLGASKSSQKKLIENKSLLKRNVVKKQYLELPIDLLNKNMVFYKYEGSEPRLIKQNNYFLALSKPVKVHSLPLCYSDPDNLLSYIRDKEISAEVLNINANSYERGLLYRLDYDTSGLVLFAKNQDFYQSFRHKMQKNKYYLAVVQGEIEDDFSFAHHISYYGKKGAIGRASDGPTKNASLEGKKIIYDSATGLGLVLLRLNEGLRHQLRIQLSHENYPIFGDPIYGNTKHNRMLLHAFCYEFNYLGCNYRVKDENVKDLEVVFNSNRVLQMANEALLSF